MHYRILYNPSVEVIVKACSLEEFMQISNLRMSTFLNDREGLFQINNNKREKKKDYQKTTLVFLADSFLHITQWGHKQTWRPDFCF